MHTEAYGSECGLKFDSGTTDETEIFGSNTLQSYKEQEFGPYCLELGNHIATLTDTYGDGWHGGYVEVTGVKYGEEVAIFGKDFTSGSSTEIAFTVKKPAAPPPVTYCNVPDEYYENGRTNFQGDVCSDCTLTQCEKQCTAIKACVGFDTNGHGTCWLKSYISMEDRDVRSADGGPRTTYFNSRLPSNKRRCNFSAA